MARVELRDPATADPTTSLTQAFDRVRATTEALCAPLEIEDFVVQSMPDASPAKWHLAHTTWFFEQFILKPHVRGYRSAHPRYDYLFNSYYQSVGPMHERPHRGLLTRPTVAEVLEYRARIDDSMRALLESEVDPQIAALTQLGLNHEQQHQELLLTDLKHLFSCNPLLPAYRPRNGSIAASVSTPMRFYTFDGGLAQIGATSGDDFVFDNETPRHTVYVEPFALANRLVTNGEYAEFIRDGGYRRADVWLSDGWATVTQQGWTRPLYWAEGLDAEFTLNGLQPLDPAAPVCHLSYYEADAFARWAGARLPSEAEWEIAAATAPVRGNLLESGLLHPQPDDGTLHDESPLRQLFGDVWEWTASPYTPYPGYRPPPGALGEYNGKFMCNQLVLRGGSCATPRSHIRATYRNFFYPHARWQFMGVRLARDL